MQGKLLDKISLITAAVAIIVTVLFINGEKIGIASVSDEYSENAVEGNDHFSGSDLTGNWDESYATVITLNGDSASISGNGAYLYDGDVVISGAGKYVVSGKLDDGSIIVDAYDSSKVWIMLSGVDISCSDSAPIYVKNAKKVYLTVKDGTDNYLRDESNRSKDAEEDGCGGVIFTHTDMTINGTGNLTIEADYRHGIDANDILKITGGNITITSAADAVHVSDEIEICNADIIINAGDDGITSGKSFYIESGHIEINECTEGIEALIVEIAGGDITIYPSDDGINANGNFASALENPGSLSGSDTIEIMDESEECYISISGGNIMIICESSGDVDGIDSNKDIYISGGTIRISIPDGGPNTAIDYGSESGGVCIISGGYVIACGTSVMTESFDETSSQCSVLYESGSSLTDAGLFMVQDSSGKTILEWDVPVAYSSVNFSCPEMILGDEITVTAGGTTETISLDEVSTKVGESSGSFIGGSEMPQMPDFEGGEMPQRPDSEGGEMPQRPDSEGGELPQKPGSENGERPQMPDFGGGEMPQRPDFEGGEMPQRPDFGNGEMPQMPDSGDESITESSDKVTLDKTQITYILLSVAVLAGALTFVIVYKRRR